MADEMDDTLERETAVPADSADEQASPAQGDAPEAEEPTARMPIATEPLPSPVEAPRPSAPAPTAEAPRLRDVGATFMGWARGRAGALRTVALPRRALFVLAAAVCAFALAFVAVRSLGMLRMPPDDQVIADAQARLAAPSRTASPYERDEPLVLQTVEIVGRQPSGTRRDACDVAVEAVFSSPGLESRADATLTYVRGDDGWTCTAASLGKASHRALAGVGTDQVLAHIEDLWHAADAASHDDAAESLASLYRDADIEVESEVFDEEEQSEFLRLHCVSTGSFVSYECDLAARFRFAEASGAWELASATASDGARTLGFGPLVGTWQGTFASQDAASGKCLAAGGTPLVVTIEQATLVGPDDARIAGTVTGVAHLHQDLASDTDAAEGDRPLEGVPFEGTLSSGDVELDVISLLAGNSPKHDEAGIVFDCVLQDLPEGKVALRLAFGRADDPDAASATLTSTHVYQDLLLMVIPYPREARFVDRFALTKIS